MSPDSDSQPELQQETTMGVMRFLIHPPEMLSGWPEVYRAYTSGYDGRVFPTRVEVDGQIVTCRRHVSESGRMHVAWPVPGMGRPVLSTSSLCESDSPYLLPLELARGKIAQVRDQLSNWQVAGMTVPEEFFPHHRRAHDLFSKAIATREQLDECCSYANRAILAACEASELLTDAYAKLRLQVRSQRAVGLPAALGCQIGWEMPNDNLRRAFEEIFTTALVPVEWKSIEPEEGTYNWDINDAQVDWGIQQRLTLCGGPLLDFSPEGLPNWLWQWEHDFFNLQSFVSDFVETAIGRYVGKIRFWEVAARPNSGGALTLSEDNRLALTLRALEVAKQVDDEVQLIVRIDQPWSEYQARGQHKLSAMQFVDALTRTSSYVSAINLEIAVGYRPRGTASRDLIAFSQMLDFWSTLGFPLFVTVVFPSQRLPSPETRTDLEVEPPQWKKPWSDQAQAEWAATYLPLIMAKQQVVGLFWGQFSDQIAHDFPHAGLVDAHGELKPLYEELRQFRNTYWNGPN